jgi:drug/metabolite transporter (DMT)-like permease
VTANTKITGKQHHLSSRRPYPTLPPSNTKIIFILTVGVLSVSASAIFVRLAIEAVDSATIGFSLFLAASRLILASSVLIPNWFTLSHQKVPLQAYRYGVGAGICLALHFATWISSLSYTSIAASTTLVTTNPLWVSLLGWWWFREKPTKTTFIGIFVALMGGILIVMADRDVNIDYPNPLLGNSLALIGAILVSGYILLGREAQRAGLNIKNYITVAYTTAGLALLPFALVLGQDYKSYPLSVYVYVLMMAIFPQLIGHTSFNWALKWVAPTLVTMVILLEPIASSLLGVLIFAEIPPLEVIYGGLILLIGVGIAIFGG